MIDPSERSLFESGVQRATETADGVELDAALDALGWRDALDDDRHTAIAVLFERQGETTTVSSALDWLLGAALGVDTGRTAVILPAVRRTDTPGLLRGGRCVVEGLATARLDRCNQALVVAMGVDGPTSFLVDPSELQHRHVQGLDPSLGMIAVKGDLDIGPGTANEAVVVDWASALALGQLALGHELVGTGRTMLELARTHALERQQFGRPIATFQAVRHHLAESLVALEAAAALLDAAWEELSPVTAAMAKAFAGRSTRAAARHCQQVLAGIGFTTEHPFHRSIRRALVVDQLLGAGSALTRQLGAEVLERAALPAAFPL